MKSSVLFAVLAAALFGVSTPFAKLLLGEVSPVLLSGLLYLGSGLGLALVRLIRHRGWQATGLPMGGWRWLLGAILFGGMLGPVLLMWGLSRTSAASASLLLNLEAVLTAVLAWLVFQENADRRVVLGMLAIVAGGVVLAWPAQGQPGTSDVLGPLAIALACLCWAIDNNLTRHIAAADALFIASGKGLVAGVVNCAMALSLGAVWPSGATVAEAMVVGLFGYGFSLVLFVLALRGLGAARTGAYFSTAPFVGALVSVALLGEPTSPIFWLACALMGLGVWLHLTEQHDHGHTHAPLEHSHRHVHDAHHQHAHDNNTSADPDGTPPHTHWHRHAVITHRHPHYPDTHHGHAH